MKRWILIIVLVLFSFTACQSRLVPDEDRSGCVVGPVPAELGFDPFYEKYCDAGGIPVISSGAVDDLALQQAYYIINNMLAPIPYSREQLIKRGNYFAVIGKDEELTELPEYAHMDSEYWDWRARGLGAGGYDKITSTAEENLLCQLPDRWYGENIAVHEFSHTISLQGLGKDYWPMLNEFTELYESAQEQGLWKDTYAISDIQEYWAEGVQDYFNVNIESNVTDGVHNYVNTREELEEYDPALFEFIDDFFHGFEWTPSCPTEE